MIIPVGFAQVAHRITLGLTSTYSICTVGVNNAVAPGDLQTQAQAAHNDFASTLLPILCQSTILESTTIKEGPVETGPSAEYVQPLPGSINDTQVPPNTSLLLQKQTALGGRENRGRMYIMGVGETSVGPTGELTGDLVQDFPDAAEQYFGKLELSQLFPVILHNSPSPPTACTAFTGSQIVATQRRRLRR